MAQLDQFLGHALGHGERGPGLVALAVELDRLDQHHVHRLAAGRLAQAGHDQLTAVVNRKPALAPASTGLRASSTGKYQVFSLSP